MNALITILGSKRLWQCVTLFAAGAIVCANGDEQLVGTALIDALRHGGYVLVLHHARSPMQKPDKATADPANANMERQLDNVGKQTSTAMGKAIEALHIPIGKVESSATFRAMQTAKYAGFEHPIAVMELTQGKQGMAADTDGHRAAWLKRAVTLAPTDRTNTVLITHTPNIAAAFGSQAQGIRAGDTLVFRPDGKGGTTMVARIKHGDWPRLRTMHN